MNEHLAQIFKTDDRETQGELHYALAFGSWIVGVFPTYMEARKAAARARKLWWSVSGENGPRGLTIFKGALNKGPLRWEVASEEFLDF